MTDFQKEVGGECPHCGGTFAAGYIGRDPAVTHSLPTCMEFERLDADVYLTSVREALEKATETLKLENERDRALVAFLRSRSGNRPS